MKKILIFTTLLLLVAIITSIYLFGDIKSYLESDKGRESAKKILKKVESIIYHEATIHNPEGDVLPDQIDDTIKERIKEKIQETSVEKE